MHKRLAHLAIVTISLFSMPVFSAEAAQQSKPWAEGKAPSARAPFGQLKTIYIVPGTRDDGAADNAGTATVVHCTNVSGANVTVRFLALSFTGAVKADKSTTIGNGGTRTAATHDTAAYSEDVVLATGTINQGSINVESTDSAVFCTAEATNAGASYPLGISRHMIRVNGLPGTQE